MDLIDRQAILKHIEKIRQSALMMDDTRRAGIIMNGMNLCEKAVRNQPSAQPEPCEDAVSRQAIFDTAAEYEKQLCEILGDENELVEVVEILKHRLIALPSAQPEKCTEERAETHACDLIDREAAVDAIYHHLPSVSRTRARTMLHEVPSAQPERKGWVHIDDIYRLIAGHSNYHGDNILSALTCLAEGKKVSKPIRVLDTERTGELPSAQLERKKGKWVHGREIAREMVGDAVTAIFYEGLQCSECKCIVEEEREPLWNFCPSCGADMRGEQDDESRSKSNAQTDTRARGMGTTDKSSGI